MAAETYDDPEPLNLGTGQETTISDLAALVARLIGYDGEIEWDTSKPDGQPRRSLDVTRATKSIGFTASIPLSEGLSETIRWWEEQQS